MLPSSPDHAVTPPHWSSVNDRFLAHWQSLRVGAGVTTSEDFLDTPDPSLHAQVFILERQDERHTVFRLMASDLVAIWGQDFTDRAMEDVFTPDVGRRYLADVWQAEQHGCGLWERGRYGDMRGRTLELEIFYLPLSVVPGRPPRVGGVLSRIDTLDLSATRRGLISMEQRTWVDIGLDVPKVPPETFTV